ncbi:MAG: fluoride efflux transporter CrcB [Myxococcales bacterium]|jgi:CrcB protein|nr:fluoride efflux transporter CrcB [Myxococcales bacterium]
MWKEIVYVGVGGGLGSILRFATSQIVSRYVQAPYLFVGTLVANLLGCLLIGILSGWLLSHADEHHVVRWLFVVGFCGGYTTFSTFALENLHLLTQGQWPLLIGYTAVSILLGIAAVWLGMLVVR